MALRRRAARSNTLSTIARMDIDPRELSEMRTIVRSHMVQGLYLTSNFKDEQVITMPENNTSCPSSQFINSVISF